MARGRFISKTLGSSRKFEALGRIPKVGEFSQTLYVLLVTNSDDFGRLPGDAFTAKFRIFPTSKRSTEDFEKALAAMCEVGLIQRYSSNGSEVAEIWHFDDHQQGLHKRSRSYYPGQDSTLNASEEDVEAVLADGLRTGQIRISNFTIVSVERQLRIGNSYLDIVATTSENLKIILEVKRFPISTAAVEQVLKYSDLIPSSIPMVVGHGLAANLTMPRKDVAVIVYDDSLSFSMLSGNVKSHSVTLTDVPAQQEQEVEYQQERESKQEQEGKACAAPAECAGPPQHSGVDVVVMVFPTSGKPNSWPLLQSKIDEYRETYSTLDVVHECKLARQWCVDNVSNRKTAGGMTRFLNHWLIKAQNEPGNKNGRFRSRPATEPVGTIDDLRKEWLGEKTHDRK
jgi:hypothetical protein